MSEMHRQKPYCDLEPLAKLGNLAQLTLDISHKLPVPADYA